MAPSHLIVGGGPVNPPCGAILRGPVSDRQCVARNRGIESPPDTLSWYGMPCVTPACLSWLVVRYFRADKCVIIFPTVNDFHISICLPRCLSVTRHTQDFRSGRSSRFEFPRFPSPHRSAYYTRGRRKSISNVSVLYVRRSILDRLQSSRTLGALHPNLVSAEYRERADRL